MSAEDVLLECRIDRAYETFVIAPTPDLQLAYFNRMRDLIALRTPEQVRRMEEARGLR